MDDYARQASAFFERGIRQNLPVKIDPRDGVIRIYDPTTNSFGAYLPNGMTKTFFKPTPGVHGLATNWDHWISQPGFAP